MVGNPIENELPSLETDVSDMSREEIIAQIAFGILGFLKKNRRVTSVVVTEQRTKSGSELTITDVRERTR